MPTIQIVNVDTGELLEIEAADLVAFYGGDPMGSIAIIAQHPRDAFGPGEYETEEFERLRSLSEQRRSATGEAEV